MGQKPSLQFELCAETLEACIAAQQGGADRIELCSALSEGGLTPSHGFVQQALQLSQLPLYPILRPRAGDFVYSDHEFKLIAADLSHMRLLGASGVVAGILKPDGSIDVDRTRHLVALAHPLEVTFHRAFDCAVDLSRALEDVIATGCARLLTSGGKPDVHQGAAVLRHLVEQAGDRICVMAGGGLRLENAADVARRSGVSAFHGSLRKKTAAGHHSLPDEARFHSYTVEAHDIRAMIQILRSAHSPSNGVGNP